MAKHPKRAKRKFRKYLRGAIDHAFSIGGLAGNTLFSSVNPGVVAEKAFVTSAKILWSMDDFTKATDVGPVMVGIAHSDYTDAEIEAWVENNQSWEEGDLVASKEIGRRQVKMVGVFRTRPAATDVAVLNQGRMVNTKLKWQLDSGATIRFWAYNMGTAAVATTVPNILIDGHANLWPN